MNLLLFNLATDADDPILAFTTVWINRLAAHYEFIDVITMRAGRLETAPNVRVLSVGKERGYSEARRFAEFYAILLKCLRQRRYTAAFAHMMPLFALMAAPMLQVMRIPITLWYTHRSPHWTVKYGMRVCRRVVTAAPDSFPFATPKLRVVGHGIDTDFFSPSRSPAPSPMPSVVHVARLMPIKHQSTLIRAIAEMQDIQAVFVGGVPPEQDSGYEHELRQLAERLGAADRVCFKGAQPPEGVRDSYRDAFAAVNLSPPGLFDKAALEAMSCAVPTIVSNAAFDDLLQEDAPRLRIETPDAAAELGARLRGLLALAADERAAMGMRLRRRVIDAHSLDALIPRLVSVINTGEVN